MEELFSSSVSVLPLGLWVSGGSLVALSFSSLHSRCQPLGDQGCFIVRNYDFIQISTWFFFLSFFRFLLFPG